MGLWSEQYLPGAGHPLIKRQGIVLQVGLSRVAEISGSRSEANSSFPEVS